MANVFSAVNEAPLWRMPNNSHHRISSPVLESLEDDIARVATLQDGWYGNGSVGVGPEVLSRTRSTAKKIGQVRGLTAPELTPTDNGTVSMEWETASISVYIEIGKSRMNGFIEIDGQEPTILPNVSEFSDGFFETIGELLRPSRGLSFALGGGSTGELVAFAS